MINIEKDELDKIEENRIIITTIARLLGYSEETSEQKPVIEKTQRIGNEVVHSKKIYDFEFGKRMEKLKETAKEFEGEYDKFKQSETEEKLDART